MVTRFEKVEDSVATVSPVMKGSRYRHMAWLDSRTR